MIGTEHLITYLSLKRIIILLHLYLKEYNLNYESVKEELDIMTESGYKPEIYPESKMPESADENDEEKEDTFFFKFI